jgi:hypothetical protein
LATLVLGSSFGANRLCTLPRAPSIPGCVAAIILNGLILGVPVCCDPQRAVKGCLFGIRRMVVLAFGLDFVALCQTIVACTREPIFPCLLKRKEVIPFFWRYSFGIP